ncbi:MAG: hypothetical protein IPM79_09535 [Polyangiaceae bacterium]|nr:hypothetical protein [Polyangiaceae bacterium]MBK8937867.1 hypothetical protein [Polyangiaceae bacterium]
MSSTVTKTLLILSLALAVSPLGACREKKAPAKEEHKPGDGHDHGEEHKPGDGHDHGSATPKK